MGVITPLQSIANRSKQSKHRRFSHPSSDHGSSDATALFVDLFPFVPRISLLYIGVVQTTPIHSRSLRQGQTIKRLAKIRKTDRMNKSYRINFINEDYQKAFEKIGWDFQLIDLDDLDTCHKLWMLRLSCLFGGVG